MASNIMADGSMSLKQAIDALRSRTYESSPYKTSWRDEFATFLRSLESMNADYVPALMVCSGCCDWDFRHWQKLIFLDSNRMPAAFHRNYGNIEQFLQVPKAWWRNTGWYIHIIDVADPVRPNNVLLDWYNSKGFHYV